MALRFTHAQIDAPIIADARLLERELFGHLLEVRPALADCYPLPYLQWVVHDTVGLAAPFRLDTVAAYRMFLLLRFDVAPGFFKQPDIGRVLADVGTPAMARWERLTQAEFGAAWVQAAEYGGSGEWRHNFWSEAA